jgi:hypothetical protein
VRREKKTGRLSEEDIRGMNGCAIDEALWVSKPGSVCRLGTEVVVRLVAVCWHVWSTESEKKFVKISGLDESSKY